MDGFCEDGSYTGCDWDLPYSGMPGGTGATKMVVVIIGAVVVGTAVGVGTSVDVGVAGMDTVVGAVFVGVGSGQGLSVCVSGAFVSASVIPAGAGVWVAVASGVRELAGNAVVAALGRWVAVGTGSWVSDGSGAGVTGLGADVAAPAGADTVATASPGVGVWSPQASRAARITRAIHRGMFSIMGPFPSLFRNSEFGIPSPLWLNVPAAFPRVQALMGGHDWDPAPWFRSHKS